AFSVGTQNPTTSPRRLQPDMPAMPLLGGNPQQQLTTNPDTVRTPPHDHMRVVQPLQRPTHIPGGNGRRIIRPVLLPQDLDLPKGDGLPFGGQSADDVRGQCGVVEFFLPPAVARGSHGRVPSAPSRVTMLCPVSSYRRYTSRTVASSNST